MERLGLVVDFCTGNCSHRTDRHDHQPDTEESEENSEDRAASAVEQANQSGALLSCSLKENRTQGVDDRIDDQRKQGAGDERNKEVWHSEKRADNWEKKTTPEDRRRIGSEQREETHCLASDAIAPAARDFEKNKNKRERQEDRLPEGGSCCHEIKVMVRLPFAAKRDRKGPAQSSLRQSGPPSEGRRDHAFLAQSD
jgi:hypothetical protein